MPVFNEARWLDAILERVLARPEVAQVVAVDDGSTDGSWAKL
jgi:glycosyltransferase involved in cell wall biosynthesis